MLAIFKRIPTLSSQFKLTGPAHGRRLIPQKPPRPQTPFLLYYKSRQDYYDFELGLTDISSITGKETKVQRLLIMRKAKEEWKVMSSEEKQPFIEDQQELRKQYFDLSMVYHQQFKYFRPTSPVAIYRNYMISSHYRKKEGEQTRSYEYKTSLFGELHLKFIQQYEDEPQEVQDVFEKIAQITKMQDTTQQIRQFVFLIPRIFLTEAGEQVFKFSQEYFSQYLIFLRKKTKSQTTFTDYIRDKVSQKDFAEYQKQITELSNAHNKPITLLEEVLIFIIYKKGGYKVISSKNRETKFFQLMEQNLAK